MRKARIKGQDEPSAESSNPRTGSSGDSEEAESKIGFGSLTGVTAIFAGGNLVATILRLLGGVLTTRVVDPSVLGLYNGIGLVRGYAPFLQCGVANGLNRELPFNVGTDDLGQARRLASAAQWWSLTVGLLAVAILSGVAGWFALQGRYVVAVGWFSFSVPVFGILYGQFYLRVLYVTHGRFPKLALINVATASIGVVTVILVWWLGFGGLCLRGVILGAVMLALLWRWRPLDVRPRWNWAEIKTLLVTGIPIFVVGQLYSWWPVLNLTMVLRYSGTRGVGLFAIADLAGPTVAMLPLALSQVVYPRMSEEYGRSGVISKLIGMAVLPTVTTFGFTLAVVIAAWFAIPPVIEMILPKYSEGTSAAQWSVVAALVLSLTPLNNIFNVVKKQGRYGLAMVGGMGTYLCALRWLIRYEVSLEAFPQAMIIGRLAFVLVCYLLIWRMFLAERKNASEG